MSFTADPGGSLAFEEDSATATAGTVTLELTNESSVPHDVQIEDGGDLGGTEEVTGGTTTADGRAGGRGIHVLLLGPRSP